MKPHYADCCGHAIRQYNKHHGTRSYLNPVETHNQHLVGVVLDALTPQERDYIRLLYNEKYTLAQSVRYHAKKSGIKPETLWALARQTEHTLAKAKNLI